MAFDFDGNQLTGLYVIPTADRLTTASLYGPEIDKQIEDLKSELDALAKKMKAELKKSRKSLFGNS